MNIRVLDCTLDEFLSNNSSYFIDRNMIYLPNKIFKKNDDKTPEKNDDKTPEKNDDKTPEKNDDKMSKEERDSKIKTLGVYFPKNLEEVYKYLGQKIIILNISRSLGILNFSDWLIHINEINFIFEVKYGTKNFTVRKIRLKEFPSLEDILRFDLKNTIAYIRSFIYYFLAYTGYSIKIKENIQKELLFRNKKDLDIDKIHKDIKYLENEGILTSRLGIFIFKILTFDFYISDTIIGKEYSKYFGKSKNFNNKKFGIINRKGYEIFKENKKYTINQIQEVLERHRNKIIDNNTIQEIIREF